MANNRSHEDAMAVALQLQAEFNRSGGKRGSDRGRGRGRGGSQAYIPRPNIEAPFRSNGMMHGDDSSARGGFQPRGSSRGGGGYSSRGGETNTWTYRGPGGRQEGSVDDFFNLDDTSDIQAGSVVYYQENDVPVPPEQHVAVGAYPTSNDPKYNNPSMTTGKNTQNAFMGNTTQASFKSYYQAGTDDAADFFKPIVSSEAQPEPDYYQEDYKNKYETSGAQRKNLQASRHAPQTDTEMTGVDSTPRFRKTTQH